METTATRRIAERFSRLSPEQRRAVYDKIRADGLSIGQFPILARDASARGRCHLSYAQLRQWLLWQLDPRGTAYHISGALRLDGRLDAEAVRDALHAIVQRHESLRTVFRADAQGLAEQWILDPGPLDFALVDLRDVAGREAREARARQEARALSDTPFDLGEGPLLRVRLVRIEAESHLLVVVMHHIVSDGWSMQIVVDEFVERYRARVLGQPLALPALALQYADYAAWQRGWLEAGERDRQLDYWQARLGGRQPVLQLPTDHPRAAVPDYGTARNASVLEPQLVEALRRRAQVVGALRQAHRELDPAVADQVGQLGRAHLGIDRHHAHAERIEREPVVQEGRPVLEQQPDAVAMAVARARIGIAQPVDLGRGLAPADAAGLDAIARGRDRLDAQELGLGRARRRGGEGGMDGGMRHRGVRPFR